MTASKEIVSMKIHYEYTEDRHGELAIHVGRKIAGYVGKHIKKRVRK